MIKSTGIYYSSSSKWRSTNDKMKLSSSTSSSSWIIFLASVNWDEKGVVKGSCTPPKNVGEIAVTRIEERSGDDCGGRIVDAETVDVVVVFPV